MKDELITFETAKLAKEKKFNWGVKGQFTHYFEENRDSNGDNFGSFGWKEGEVTYDDSYIVNGESDLGDLSNESYECIARPTQSLLQKWLREEHNICVTPYSNPSLIKEYYDSYNYRIVTLNTEHKDPNFFFTTNSPYSDDKIEESMDNGIQLKSTYEEALEVGLVEALNLVEV
jgi:hypothetical protein